MKNRIIKIVLIIISLFSINTLTVSAEEEYPYYIDNYDVNIKVNENNILEIKETIDVYFNEARHGIYRDIPRINKVKRLDGSTSTNRAKINVISVNDKYSLSKTIDGFYEIKIGLKDNKIKGSKQYRKNMMSFTIIL